MTATFADRLRSMFLAECLDKANTLGDLRKLTDQIIALHDTEVARLTRELEEARAIVRAAYKALEREP